MKFLIFILTLLFSAASILSAPVTNNELSPRGGYGKTTKVIVATTYVVTETEILYEAKCAGPKCHYKVHRFWIGVVVMIKAFYEALAVDVEIVFVEVDLEVVYFKCKQPDSYVASKCEKYGFSYIPYPKGSFSYNYTFWLKVTIACHGIRRAGSRDQTTIATRLTFPEPSYGGADEWILASII